MWNSEPGRVAPFAPSARAGALWAALAALGWAWAAALLSTREHWTTFYNVVTAASALWGFLGLSNLSSLTILAAAAMLGVLCHGEGRRNGQVLPACTRWLLAAWIVPLADVVRLAGWQVPVPFLEPIWIAAVTWAATRQFAGPARPGSETARCTIGPAQDRECPSFPGTTKWPEKTGLSPSRMRAWLDGLAGTVPTVWFLVVWALAVACAAWWYFQSQRAYDSYLLGYNDFGHFAWRVANTWEGRGFLMETPGLPAFWDHFNPGLALLAPLWGLWPDARLFLVIQALCLVLPAPLVYTIARRLGGSPGTGAAWAAAYLVYPALGQINLSCTYGWHPVSLVLPLVFAAMAAWLSGWPVVAGAACLLACSFQEDVLAVLACVCLMMSLEAWLHRRRDQAARREAAPVAGRLPWWAWLAACAAFLAAFAAVFQLAPFSRYQVGRFDRLGGSFGEVLLSPLLRPRAFWGAVMRQEVAYFLLALAVPLGLLRLGALRRAWSVLGATLVPLAVLVVWGHAPATSIAFHYTTALVPLLFLGAMVGAAPAAAPPSTGTVPVFAAKAAKMGPSPSAAGQRAGSLGASGLAALAACALASTWLGAMPWSYPTLTDVFRHTYPSDDGETVLPDRQRGSPGITRLNAIVHRVGGRQSSVLATGRVASHLLGVRRLDTVAQAGERWSQFEAEVGPGRSPIELFDFLVLDLAESFYQSAQQCQFIIEQARRAGYRVAEWQNDILVYARPRASPLAE